MGSSRDPKIHFEYEDEPFCGMNTATAQMTTQGKKVTCKRCVQIIGIQEIPIDMGAPLILTPAQEKMVAEIAEFRESYLKGEKRTAKISLEQALQWALDISLEICKR